MLKWQIKLKKVLLPQVIFISIAFMVSLAFAAQDAVVVTEGAIVYNKANFDSTVLGYLRAGETVRISDKTIGAFYRVRFKNQTAYVSDVDVRIEGAAVSSLPDEQSSSPFFQDEGQDEENPSFPRQGQRQPGKHLTKVKQIGIVASYVRYFDHITNLTDRETVNAQTSRGVFSYGLKFTLPSATLSSRLLWDISTHVSLQAPPGYSSSFSAYLDPHFLFFLDTILPNNGFLFVGLGPSFTYWNVKKNENDQNPITGYGFNVVLSAHFGIRIKAIAFKIEPRYYLLNAARYFAILASLQKVF